MNSTPDSPARSAPTIGRLPLWFGILAPPLAWSLQALVSPVLSNVLCRLRGDGVASAQVRALSAPFLVVTLATLALALAGGWMAWHNWNKARAEQRDVSSDLVEIGIERTRFFARCGLINAIVFLTAFLFTTAELLVAPLCMQ